MDISEAKKLLREHSITIRYAKGISDAFISAHKLISDMEKYWDHITPTLEFGEAGFLPKRVVETNRILIPQYTVIYVVMLSIKKSEDTINSLLNDFSIVTHKLQNIKPTSYNAIVQSSLSLFIAHELGHAYLNHKKSDNKDIYETEADIYSALFLYRLFKEIHSEFKKNYKKLSESNSQIPLALVMIGFCVPFKELIEKKKERCDEYLEDRLFKIIIAFSIMCCTYGRYPVQEFKDNLLYVYNNFIEIDEEEFHNKFFKIAENVEPILEGMITGKKLSAIPPPPSTPEV